ncbi:hypothetical protein K501DRAFT_270824 [Backusella circina FSU 941]|nr:hypothetical protein K501DRAFT_270824 [Backusella circina FSU 941]
MSNPYQSPELVQYLKNELRRYDDDDQTGNILCCLLGPEGYNISNKKSFERRAIQDKLDAELAKPQQPGSSNLMVSAPSSSTSPYKYRNKAQIQFYRNKISELEDDSDVDWMCCLFGVESEAYRTKKILERQNYERKLQEELEKPLGPSELPSYTEKAAPLASMGTVSVSYRNPAVVNDLKKKLAYYEKKIEENENSQDFLVCLCGPSAYAYSTNDILEKQGLEKKLERELAKPIDPTVSKDSKAYAAMQAPNISGYSEYQDEKNIASLRSQIQELEDGYSETCCILCFGAQGMAYQSHNQVKKEDLLRKLEKELSKPKRTMNRY